MKNKAGKYIEPELKKDGSPKMVLRGIFLEPSLIDLLDRIAEAHGVTRSTLIRCDIKKQYNHLNKISGINWTESYI